MLIATGDEDARLVWRGVGEVDAVHVMGNQMNNADATPSLTVYSVGAMSAGDCHAVLQELRRQTIADQLEVLIVAPHDEGIEASQTAGFARFEVITPESIDYNGQAMAVAVRAAAAPYTVYAEEHTYLADDWAERLVAAHRRGYEAVGFPLENANPGSLTSWAHLFGQFSNMVAPVASGEVDFLAGHHVSYSRDLLLGYGPLLEEMLENEAAIFLDLRRRGIAMYMAGDAISRHINVAKLGALMQLDYRGQRGFAATRAKSGGWSWPRRLFYAAASPLVPPLRLARTLPHLLRNPEGRRRLPGILGPLSVMLLAGGGGEMLGYLFGPGRTAEDRLASELQREAFTTGGATWVKPRAG
jgi:hypothetical protein